MGWECSECGAVIEEVEHPPNLCPSCGLAGVIFTPVDDPVEDELGGVMGVWHAAGLLPEQHLSEGPEMRFIR